MKGIPLDIASDHITPVKSSLEGLTIAFSLCELVALDIFKGVPHEGGCINLGTTHPWVYILKIPVLTLWLIYFQDGLKGTRFPHHKLCQVHELTHHVHTILRIKGISIREQCLAVIIGLFLSSLEFLEFPPALRTCDQLQPVNKALGEMAHLVSLILDNRTHILLNE